LLGEQEAVEYALLAQYFLAPDRVWHKVLEFLLALAGDPGGHAVEIVWTEGDV
jgi:hypothetical protein